MSLLKGVTCSLWLASCASSMPVMGGGRITPAGRFDFAAGAASRVTTQSLPRQSGTDDARLARAAFGGALPFAFMRYGVSRSIDVGGVVSPWQARLDFRYAWLLNDDRERWSIISSLSPHVGFLKDVDQDTLRLSGGRYGVTLPLLLALDAGGVYEAWTGPWVAAEFARGTVEDRSAPTATTSDLDYRRLAAGYVLGFGAGFRHLHGLVELNVSREQYSGNVAQGGANFGVWVLMPSFALRFRY